jgi:signal transduction histidine kinase
LKRAALRKGFRSPTSRLLAGLAITLAVVAAFCFYALYQIAGLRDLQNQTIERNRKDSLQLLRTQNDLSALGLAMRDMLSGDESYPLYAYSAQFDRIRQDIGDAIRIEGELTSFVNSPARQAAFRRGLSQFWISTGQVFQLARDGKEAQALALVENSLEPQEASLMTAVSRLLVENNETQQKTAARVAAIYNRVEGQIYWLFAAALAAIALTSLMLIRANRTIFRRMEHLSEQRSGLARKLITMQEEVFRSISRELHDEFGQMLTAVGAMLGRARRQHCPPQLTGDLDEIRAIAQDALDKTRSLTQTLHPSILDDGGLEEAIDWYLSVFEKQTGIHVNLAKSGVSPELGHELGEEIPIHVYRVMQESLNNLAKHSRSASAWVRIRLSEDLLELEVEDRGIGLPPGGPAKSHGMGLIAMRERAALLRGTIEFLRPEKGGTLVRLRVPLNSLFKTGEDENHEPGRAVLSPRTSARYDD